jgi:hypothetical protein
MSAPMSRRKLLGALPVGLIIYHVAKVPGAKKKWEADATEWAPYWATETAEATTNQRPTRTPTPRR